MFSTDASTASGRGFIFWIPHAPAAAVVTAIHAPSCADASSHEAGDFDSRADSSREQGTENPLAQAASSSSLLSEGATN
jgi:hypothetical protein